MVNHRAKTLCFKKGEGYLSLGTHVVYLAPRAYQVHDTLALEHAGRAALASDVAVAATADAAAGLG